jgi:hypothetical protein
MARLWHWLLGALALVAAPRGAAARPAAAAHGKSGGAAASLMEKAKAALLARDPATARQALTQAYRASATPEILYLLGRVAEAEGRALDTHDLMRRYLTDPARVPDDEAAGEAQRVVKQPRPPSGQIVVLGAPGSLILVDDRLVGSVPLSQPLLVSPGEHRITLTLGSRRLDTPVPVQAGRSFEVRFTQSSAAVLITLLPAVLWVTEHDGVADEAQNPLADAAEQAARAAEQTLLGSEAALARAPELAACLPTTECRQQLARKNEVEYVLVSRVQRRALTEAAAPPRTTTMTATMTTTPPPTPAPAPAPAIDSWQLTLTLWHTEIATPAAQKSATCERCTAEQAAQALKLATSAVLAEGLHRGHGSLSVRVEPADAELRVAGQVVAAPYQEALWSGRYALSLRRPGWQPTERTIELGDGQKEEVALQLDPDEPAPVAPPSPPPAVAPPPAQPPPRPRWRLVTGGALLGAGLLLDGFGISAAVASGWCANPTTVDRTSPSCLQVYNTHGAEYGLLPLGTALVAAGVILIALPGSAPRKK